MKRTQPFWIRERHNPQLGVYYTAMGQMPERKAKRHERPVYGENRMLRFDSEADYKQGLEKFKDCIFPVDTPSPKA